MVQWIVNIADVSTIQTILTGVTHIHIKHQKNHCYWRHFLVIITFLNIHEHKQIIKAGICHWECCISVKPTRSNQGCQISRFAVFQVGWLYDFLCWLFGIFGHLHDCLADIFFCWPFLKICLYFKAKPSTTTPLFKVSSPVFDFFQHFDCFWPFSIRVWLFLKI